MATNQTREYREDIEDEIEEQKEEIYKYQHALRWFTRIVRTFWFGIVVAVITITAAAILSPLNIPILQPTLAGIGTTSAIITILTVIAMGVYSFNSYGSIEKELLDNLKNLREAKRELAKIYRKLVYYDEQSLKQLTAEQYMHQLPGLIASYRKRADRYRNWFVSTQIITILLSTAITSLSGGWLDRYFSIPWIIPVIGALI